MTQETNNSIKSSKDDRMTKHSGSGGNGETKKKNRNKIQAPEFMTRIVVRQLPPTMSEEQFLEAVSPLPSHSEFYYVNGDLNLGEFSFSRAYIKFYNIKDVLLFKDKYDDYVFLDSKGNEYPAIVEYAPLQKLRFNSINIKKDSKVNTIESDPDFIVFKEELEKSQNGTNTQQTITTAEQLLEEIENKESKENVIQTTPLVEYLNKKRLERIKVKEDKKRIKKEEQKRKKKEKIEKANNKKDKNVQLDMKQHPKKNNKEQTNKQEHKIVVDNKINESTVTKEQQPSAPKSSNSSKPEENLTKTLENNKTDLIKNCTKENVSGEGTEVKNDKEQKERIRNKDRPTREIYRPGMVRQQRQSTNTTGGDVTTKNEKQELGETLKSSSNHSKKNSQQAQPKYKNRVFTRTKN